MSEFNPALTSGVSFAIVRVLAPYLEDGDPLACVSAATRAASAAFEAAHYAELTSHLRQLVKYSRFQINEGADYHPTLPSAVRAAEELLEKIGGDA